MQSFIVKLNHEHWAHEIRRPFIKCIWHVSINWQRINNATRFLCLLYLGRRRGGQVVLKSVIPTTF